MDRESLRSFLEHIREYQSAIAADRHAAADDRRAAAEDRRAAARDRELASWARQQAAVEDAQAGPAYERSAAPAQPLPPPAPDEPSLDIQLDDALRKATAKQSDALDSARRAADLAGALAATEQAVAKSLLGLDASQDPEATARRLKLAQAATEGARVATERGERLRDLAERFASRLEGATLRSLLVRAAIAFTELAHAESAIAVALDSLAAHEDPEEVAAHRQEADEARTASDHALARAYELHRLQLSSYRESSGRPEVDPTA